MKKTLISMAILGAACGTVAAQSNVTLYGIVDGGVNVSKISGGDTKVSMANGVLSGNRWGLKGTEDLGNGNMVKFQLESGFALFSGETKQNGGTFSRQATLAVAGNWGEVAFGYMGALSSDSGSYTILPTTLLGTAYDNVANITSALIVTDRYNNTVVYVSPEMAGVKAYAMYSNGIDKDEKKWSYNDHYYGLGATYAAGALSAGIIAEVIDNKGLTIDNMKATQLYTLGASYDFGAFAVQGVYQYAKNARNMAFATLDSASPKGAEQNAFSISASTPVCGGTAGMQVSYAFGKDKGAAIGTEDEYSSLSVGAAYTYPISKRTTAYSYAGYRSTDKLLKEDAANRSAWSASVGLRHTF